MIKIIHRVNDPQQLRNIDIDCGVEVDIHAYGERLVVRHDAFQGGPNFSDWLAACGDRFVILNIKEEGIETRVREMVLEAGITRFFMLDLSFPSLVKMVRKGETRIALRVSEYESVNSALSLQSKVDWVWLDCFVGFPISGEEFMCLKDSGYRVCLVSPELHGPPRSQDDIRKMQGIIRSLGVKIDAVCTKYPHIW